MTTKINLFVPSWCSDGRKKTIRRIDNIIDGMFDVDMEVTVADEETISNIHDGMVMCAKNEDRGISVFYDEVDTNEIVVVCQGMESALAVTRIVNNLDSVISLDELAFCVALKNSANIKAYTLERMRDLYTESKGFEEINETVRRQILSYLVKNNTSYKTFNEMKNAFEVDFYEDEFIDFVNRMIRSYENGHYGIKLQ